MTSTIGFGQNKEEFEQYLKNLASPAKPSSLIVKNGKLDNANNIRVAIEKFKGIWGQDHTNKALVELEVIRLITEAEKQGFINKDQIGLIEKLANRVGLNKNTEKQHEELSNLIKSVKSSVLSKKPFIVGDKFVREFEKKHISELPKSYRKEHNQKFADEEGEREIIIPEQKTEKPKSDQSPRAWEKAGVTKDRENVLQQTDRKKIIEEEKGKEKEDADSDNLNDHQSHEPVQVAVEEREKVEPEHFLQQPIDETQEVATHSTEEIKSQEKEEIVSSNEEEPKVGDEDSNGQGEEFDKKEDQRPQEQETVVLQNRELETKDSQTAVKQEIEVVKIVDTPELDKTHPSINELLSELGSKKAAKKLLNELKKNLEEKGLYNEEFSDEDYFYLKLMNEKYELSVGDERNNGIKHFINKFLLIATNSEFSDNKLEKNLEKVKNLDFDNAFALLLTTYRFISVYQFYIKNEDFLEQRKELFATKLKELVANNPKKYQSLSELKNPKFDLLAVPEGFKVSPLAIKGSNTNNQNFYATAKKVGLVTLGTLASLVTLGLLIHALTEEKSNQLVTTNYLNTELQEYLDSTLKGQKFIDDFMLRASRVAVIHDNAFLTYVTEFVQNIIQPQSALVSLQPEASYSGSQSALVGQQTETGSYFESLSIYPIILGTIGTVITTVRFASSAVGKIVGNKNITEEDDEELTSDEEEEYEALREGVLKNLDDNYVDYTLEVNTLIQELEDDIAKLNSGEIEFDQSIYDKLETLKPIAEKLRYSKDPDEIRQTIEDIKHQHLSLFRELPAPPIPEREDEPLYEDRPLPSLPGKEPFSQRTFNPLGLREEILERYAYRERRVNWEGVYTAETETAAELFLKKSNVKNGTPILYPDPTDPNIIIMKRKIDVEQTSKTRKLKAETENLHINKFEDECTRVGIPYISKEKAEKEILALRKITEIIERYRFRENENIYTTSVTEQRSYAHLIHSHQTKIGDIVYDEIEDGSIVLVHDFEFPHRVEVHTKSSTTSGVRSEEFHRIDIDKFEEECISLNIPYISAQESYFFDQQNLLKQLDEEIVKRIDNKDNVADQEICQKLIKLKTKALLLGVPKLRSSNAPPREHELSKIDINKFEEECKRLGVPFIPSSESFVFKLTDVREQLNKKIEESASNIKDKTDQENYESLIKLKEELLLYLAPNPKSIPDKTSSLKEREELDRGVESIREEFKEILGLASSTAESKDLEDSEMIRAEILDKYKGREDEKIYVAKTIEQAEGLLQGELYLSEKELLLANLAAKISFDKRLQPDAQEGAIVLYPDPTKPSQILMAKKTAERKQTVRANSIYELKKTEDSPKAKIEYFAVPVNKFEEWCKNIGLPFNEDLRSLLPTRSDATELNKLENFIKTLQSEIGKIGKEEKDVDESVILALKKLEDDAKNLRNLNDEEEINKQIEGLRKSYQEITGSNLKEKSTNDQNYEVKDRDLPPLPSSPSLLSREEFIKSEDFNKAFDELTKKLEEDKDNYKEKNLAEKIEKIIILIEKKNKLLEESDSPVEIQKALKRIERERFDLSVDFYQMDADVSQVPHKADAAPPQPLPDASKAPPPPPAPPLPGAINAPPPSKSLLEEVKEAHETDAYIKGMGFEKIEIQDTSPPKNLTELERKIAERAKSESEESVKKREAELAEKLRKIAEDKKARDELEKAKEEARWNALTPEEQKAETERKEKEKQADLARAEEAISWNVELEDEMKKRRGGMGDSRIFDDNNPLNQSMTGSLMGSLILEGAQIEELQKGKEKSISASDIHDLSEFVRQTETNVGELNKFMESTRRANEEGEKITYANKTIGFVNEITRLSIQTEEFIKNREEIIKKHFIDAKELTKKNLSEAQQDLEKLKIALEAETKNEELKKGPKSKIEPQPKNISNTADTKELKKADIQNSGGRRAQVKEIQKVDVKNLIQKKESQENEKLISLTNKVKELQDEYKNRKKMAKDILSQLEKIKKFNDKAAGLIAAGKEIYTTNNPEEKATPEPGDDTFKKMKNFGNSLEESGGNWDDDDSENQL